MKIINRRTNIIDMKEVFVASPSPENFLSRLNGHLPKNEFSIRVLFCDVAIDQNPQQILNWVDSINLDYVIIELTSFDEDNCQAEQEISSYLQKRSIPADFILPKVCIHTGADVLLLSVNTGIKHFLEKLPDSPEELADYIMVSCEP